MPIIEWNQQYLTGIQQVDLNHQYLFVLLNKTYDEFIANGPISNAEIIFDELIDYATYHFFIEEQVMERSSYPGLERHKREHAGFSAEVVSMYNGHRNGASGVTLEILCFLSAWLKGHIMVKDMEIGRFLDGTARKRAVERNRRSGI